MVIFLWAELFDIAVMQGSLLERQFCTLDVGTKMRTTSMKRNWQSTGMRVS